jgi:hypothetical protein
MSTPIENVRGFLAHVAARSTKPHELRFCQDLASVLRDAERFQALEQAHERCDSPDAWSYVNSEGDRRFYKEPLAELADKLRSETK